MLRSRGNPRVMVALGLGLAVLLLFVVSFAVLRSAGTGGSGGSADQCAKPVSQRTGGWVCPR
jgi:hypothetical protein